MINHSPTCTCFERYTGNPFIYCSLIVEARKSSLKLLPSRVFVCVDRLNRIANTIFLQRLCPVISILANRLLAGRTVNASRAMAKLFALVCQLTLARRPVVDPNAQLAQSARQIALAKTTNVSIPVPTRAVREQPVEL